MTIEKRFLKGLVVWIVTLLVVAAGVQAAGAEGPAVNDEILRGAKAASNCYDEYPPDLILKEKTDCMEQAKSESLRRGTASDPFLLGLFLKAWTLMNKEVKDMEPMYRMMERNAEHEVARKRVESYLSMSKEIQGKLGITDKTLCDLARLKCEPSAGPGR
jgi:hypothetical protein